MLSNILDAKLKFDHLFVLKHYINLWQYLVFQLSIARLGSTVNFLVVGPLFAVLAQTYVPHVAVGWTLLIAGSTCVMSFITAVVSNIFNFLIFLMYSFL